MDFSFSDDQQALRELARKIMGDLSTHDRLAELEASEDRFDLQLWEELARAGLLGTAVDAAYGGSGFGFFELAILLEEMGRAVARVPLLPTLVQGALTVQEFGSDELKRRILPAVVQGECILSAALVEPGAPPLEEPATTARRDGAGWRLDGTKLFVPAAHLASFVLVPARVEGEGLGVFLVDPTGEGVTLERQETTDRGFEARLSFAGAAAEALVGEVGRGGEILRALVDRTTVGLCAAQLGVTERALRITADYMREREQFGRPIGSFQAAHVRTADAFIDVETIRLTAWEAAARIADGRPDPDSIAIAKFFASEAGYRVVYAALHLHGGIGSDVDYPVHRYYLWARQIELTLGGAHEQLKSIGARLAA